MLFLFIFMYLLNFWCLLQVSPAHGRATSAGPAFAGWNQCQLHLPLQRFRLLKLEWHLGPCLLLALFDISWTYYCQTVVLPHSSISEVFDIHEGSGQRHEDEGETGKILAEMYNQSLLKPVYAGRKCDCKWGWLRQLYGSLYKYLYWILSTHLYLQTFIHITLVQDFCGTFALEHPMHVPAAPWGRCRHSLGCIESWSDTTFFVDWQPLIR